MAVVVIVVVVIGAVVSAVVVIVFVSVILVLQARFRCLCLSLVSGGLCTASAGYWGVVSWTAATFWTLDMLLNCVTGYIQECFLSPL